MKKLISFVTIIFVIFLTSLSAEVYAAPLGSVDVTTTKQTIHPGENVTVNIEFGQDLGAYTVDVAYDNNLFEYVSSEGGTENDNGTRVRVYFFDSAGGTSPRNNMSVTFRAKQGIITSNPTDFSITAEGLANPAASVNYDDITTPIVKSVVVEPKYVDYSIDLKYTGNIIANVKKDMKITISSSMGKSYAHTRIIAEAKTPNGATAKLLAKDNQSLEHDIIQSGWGDAAGDPIGGKDVVKTLNTQGLFDKEGTYSITLKLIDRDNSDAVIATKTFSLQVQKQQTSTPGTGTNGNTNSTNNNTNNKNEIDNDKTNESKEPTTLPKTGNTVYFLVVSVLMVLASFYYILRNKE